MDCRNFHGSRRFPRLEACMRQLDRTWIAEGGGVAPHGLAEQQGPCCRAEERANVYWNNHPDHSRDRAARGLFRYRRRAVLRDRLLWWRRPWTDHCYPADPAPVGTNLGDPTVTRPTRHSGARESANPEFRIVMISHGPGSRCAKSRISRCALHVSVLLTKVRIQSHRRLRREGWSHSTPQNKAFVVIGPDL